MIVLALESSTPTASLALLEGSTVLAAEQLPSDQPTTATLFTVAQSLFGEAGRKPRDVNIVAVSQGPGSFTGLRIGATFAKTFCYATSSQLVSVPTSETIALRAWKERFDCPLPSAATSNGPGIDDGFQPVEVHGANSDAADRDSVRLQTVIDAQRQQLFVQTWSLEKSSWPRKLDEVQIVSRETWLAELEDVFLVSGPGMLAVGKMIQNGRKRNSYPDENPVWQAWQSVQSRWLANDAPDPRAEELGQLAWKSANAGVFDSPWELTPDYGRASAAEEKATGRSS